MASNPYLADQAGAITNQVTQNLQNQILPGVGAAAMQAGGYGGSRHGIAQGLAIGQTNQGLSNSLAGLYGNAYEGDQNRAMQSSIASMNNDTQRYGLQNQFTLGLGGLDNQSQSIANQYNLGLGGLSAQQQQNQGQLGLGYYTADQNFYQGQRAQDLQAMGLGANLMGQGNLGLAAGGQGLFQTGQQQQQAPYNALQQYANMLAPFTGLNQSSTQTQPGGSTIGNALGGAMTAAQIIALLTGNKG